MDADGFVQIVDRKKDIRFAVLSRDWGPDTDELTPTLKVRRKVVADKYAAAIEALYA